MSTLSLSRLKQRDRRWEGFNCGSSELSLCLLLLKKLAVIWSSTCGEELCFIVIFVPNLTVWTRVGAGYFIRCPPKGLASSPTLLLELQIRHIRLTSFYPPFVYHRGRSCCGVCQCSCPCQPSLRAFNPLSQMMPLLNQWRWIKTIPAWRLESLIVPTHFVPPQLHYSTTVFFRIRSCQMGPCSHSFPLYNLLRVSIHSICMAFLWLGRRRRKLLKLGRKGNLKPGHLPTQINYQRGKG